MAGEDTSQPPPPIASPEALQMVSSVKLHILKKGEYILWTMKMEQYLAYTDYALWEVILNGNGAVQMTKDEAGNEIEVPPVTAQQILARTRERKAKSTLLMAIPDEHLARFHGIKDAKTLWAAIKPDLVGLDKGYDRFQRLLSLLEIHRASFSTEDANQKFLRSLPSAGSNISLIMRNKLGIDNLDIDDLYNNLKIYEADIKGSSRSSSNSQNMAFVFAESTSSTNKLNAGYSVSTATCHEQIDQDDLEEIDLKWQVAMLSMRSYQVEEEATDFALMAFTSNPSSSSSLNSEFNEKEVLDVKEEEVTETVFDNHSSDEENSLASDRFKKGKGYHAVPSPLTGNYMPPKSDILFVGLDDSIYKFKISETITSLAKDEKDNPETSTSCVEKPKEDRSSAPLI
nr:ribonuclease H-like domain-containing protein [Tanacetum cinerariifolium]